MDKGDEKLLEDDGWTVDCESPLEISDADGSSASGRAADYVLDYLRDCSNSDLAWCRECGREEALYGKTLCQSCSDDLKDNKPEVVLCRECGVQEVVPEKALCESCFKALVARRTETLQIILNSMD